MKATGIVRRIDELGRVVIPKEIRRTQRIRQGDALEIFTAADGQVVFKKYSPLVELGELAGVYAEVLAKNLGPEAPVISGIAHDRYEALATVRGVPNEPGMAAKVFTELATAGVNVDMIVQAGASVGTADISFTVPESAVKQVQNTLLDKQEVLGYHSFDVDTNVGKVAVVGVGMKTHAGLAAKFFQALSDEGINVLMISTSEIRIAALVPLDQLNDAVKALHTAYGLDADQIEAVVYGGTGR